MSKAVQPTGSQHDCEIGEQNPMSRKNDPLISLVVACLDPLPELQYDGGEHPVITESIVYAVQAPRDRCAARCGSSSIDASDLSENANF